MGKLFCSQFFAVVSLACFSLGTQSLLADATLTLSDGQTYNNTLSITGVETVGVTSGTATLSGEVSGTGSLVSVGPGTLVLAGSNTFLGGTTLNFGQLNLANNLGLGTPSGSWQNPQGTLTLNTGTTFFLNNGITANNFITLSGVNTIGVASGTATLSGIINSTGSLVAVGPGTLVLAGTNTYTGGTTLNFGQLNLANNYALGTGTLTFNTGTTLLLNKNITVPNYIILSGTNTIGVESGETATLSGIISQSGSLVVVGPGTLVLSGVNTFVGGTTLLAGQINLASSYALGKGTLTMTTGTTLMLYDGVSVSNNIVLPNPSFYSANINGTSFGTSTLSGSISGDNLLTTGTGILNLTGSSPSFSGGISVASGDLVVTNNIGTTASPPGPLTVASLASSTSPDLSVTLTVTSTGIIDCSTLNNYGTVTVDGEIVCTDTANVYGAINGTGIIEAASVTVYDNGFVSAGNSPGVLTFIAATDFLPGSTVSVYIDPTQFAELVVIGDLTLGSDVTVEFRPLPGCYVNGQRYKFLTVEGGDLSGTFTNVDMGTLLLTPSIAYGDGGAVLTVNRTNLTTVATGNNALAVAGALQTKIASDSSPALCSAVGKLILSSQEEISSIFSQMQPSLFKALIIAQENNAVKVRDTLSYRMQVVLDGAHCQTVFAKENSEPKNTCSNDQKPFHAWVDGMGDSLNQRSMYFAGSPQVGYNENMGGVVAGLDYHFAKYLYAGVLGAYTDSTLKWRESQGTGDIQSGYAGLYFSAVSDMFYGNASVIGSWNSFSAHRNINFPLEVVTAKNSHGGDQLLSHIDTGVNLGWNGFTIRPFDSFDYITGTENSYTETGADALDLTVDKSNSIMLRNELGLNFAGCFCMPYGKWMLSPKISWVREVRVKGSEYTAEFEGTDLPFTVEGFFPDRSLVSPGVSLTGAFLEGLLTIGLYYNGEFNGNYSDHSYGGQVRFGF